MIRLPSSPSPQSPDSALASDVGLATEAGAVVLADVRTGSPFAAGTALPQPGTTLNSRTIAPEAIGQGVWQETATSAVFASWMLIGFGTAGWMWFPAGGIAIALLGMAVSLLGLSSRQSKLAVVGLVIHGGILVGCYIKSM